MAGGGAVGNGDELRVVNGHANANGKHVDTHGLDNGGLGSTLIAKVGIAVGDGDQNGAESLGRGACVRQNALANRLQGQRGAGAACGVGNAANGREQAGFGGVCVEQKVDGGDRREGGNGNAGAIGANFIVAHHLLHKGKQSGGEDARGAAKKRHFDGARAVEQEDQVDVGKALGGRHRDIDAAGCHK